MMTMMMMMMIIIIIMLIKNPNLKSLLKSKWQINVPLLHRSFWSSKKRNKTTTNKQIKTKEKINKNGNNNTYHEPLSEDWIGRRS